MCVAMLPRVSFKGACMSVLAAKLSKGNDHRTHSLHAYTSTIIEPYDTSRPQVSALIPLAEPTLFQALQLHVCPDLTYNHHQSL